MADKLDAHDPEDPQSSEPGSLISQIARKADQLARRGESVTIRAIQGLFAQRPDPGTIQAGLMLWRRRARDTAEAPTPPGLPPGAALPPELAGIIQTFSRQLNKAWQEGVAAGSESDQIAVLRAAADARLREAEATIDALEDRGRSMERQMVALGAERDGLLTVLEATQARLDALQAQQDQAGAGQAQQEGAAVQAPADSGADGLAAENDRLKHEIEALRQISMRQADWIGKARNQLMQIAERHRASLGNQPETARDAALAEKNSPPEIQNLYK